jgi:nitronate monooxygenase
MAPMAGACPSSLAIAVANAGGMGGMGALLNGPEGIASWVSEFRASSNGSFQFNVWIPDPPPWFACATTLAEALAAERAGADAIVA